MTASKRVARGEIVHLARQWIGTPYHHQASERCVGADCIGLVRGIWRTLYGREPQVLPGYSRDWAEASGRETLIEAARHHFKEIDPAAAQPGDVLVFRYRQRSIAKHVGIIATGRTASTNELTPRPATFIHAVEGAPVAEVPLGGWWQRRIAAAFAFPGTND